MNYNDPGLKKIIINALKEDIGRGDITTAAFIRTAQQVEAILLVKEPCVVCGLYIAQTVFKTQDKKIRFIPLVKEGECVKKNIPIAIISGNARNILAAERTALNFLTHLSGIATMTRKFVDLVKPYKTKIVDTRKTIPSLRLLQKYATRIGGGFNHRMGLDEMFMIKDNHLKIIGKYSNLQGLKNKKYKLELEIKNLKEFKEALRLKPDVIMLDNMNIKDIRSAVLLKKRIKHKTLLEASGGINLNNARKIASTGVNLISIGSLTHSVRSVDISLEIL